MSPPVDDSRFKPFGLPPTMLQSDPAPPHRDDVTIAAACWGLIMEISGDGVWNVEVWRNTHGQAVPGRARGALAGKQPCCVTVFGPWGEKLDSRLFDSATHFDALASAAKAVRAVRNAAPERVKALGKLLEVGDTAECACTAKQRASGHKDGCWYPAFSEALEDARKAVLP